MSDQETAAKPAKKAGNPAVTWTIRIVVFGALGALLIVAILEFRAKKQMGASLAAVGDKVEVPDSQVTLSEAEELLVGSPEMADGKAGGALKRKIYTWSGPLQKHRLAIHYREFNKKKIVDKITPDVDDAE